MDRRDFLKAVGGTGAAVGGMSLGLPVLGAAPEGPIDPTGIIPADKGIAPEMFAAWKRRGERRVYRGPNLHTIGMPIGGICAGQLYLLGDGTLGGWHIDGRLNATGYGSASYRTKRPESELVQGFRVEAQPYNLPKPPHFPVATDGAEFAGEYPIGEVRLPVPPELEGLSVLQRA
jgi:hypothetical protein